MARTQGTVSHNGKPRILPRAVAYIRVSSEEHAKGDRFSLPAQRREIAAFCQAKGWEIVGWYADEGVSARSDTIAKRPELHRLLTETASGAVQADVVVVHEVSCWARNRAVFFNTLADLAERRVAFASVKEDIDYSTPRGQMFLSILATFAAYFSDALAAHTSKGKRERARQGFYNGDLPFGYRNPTPGKAGEYNKTVPLIVDDEAAGVRLAFEAYAAGTVSDAGIASVLNQRGYQTPTRSRWRAERARCATRTGCGPRTRSTTCCRTRSIPGWCATRGSYTRGSTPPSSTRTCSGAARRCAPSASTAGPGWSRAAVPTC